MTIYHTLVIPAPKENQELLPWFLFPLLLPLAMTTAFSFAALGMLPPVLRSSPEPTPASDMPMDMVKLDHSLHELADLDEWRIVVLGSSSVWGAGASSQLAAFPARLEARLQMLFPGKKITVYNKGVSGEVTADMHQRFDRDVLSLKPHILIWQTLTNEIVRELSLEDVPGTLHTDIKKAKAAGAKVLLMDTQRSDMVDLKVGAANAIKWLAQIAKNEQVGIVKRHEAMRYREQKGVPLSHMLSEDMFHMNDESYDWLADFIARGIHEAVLRPHVHATAISAGKPVP